MLNGTQKQCPFIIHREFVMSVLGGDVFEHLVSDEDDKIVIKYCPDLFIKAIFCIYSKLDRQGWLFNSGKFIIRSRLLMCFLVGNRMHELPTPT